jgi:peptide/nickel transport system permease protein
MPTTLALVSLALLFSVTIGIPAGLLSAAFRNSWIDHAARLLTLVGLSLPSFWLGLMLIIFFSLWLDLLPIVGYEPITRGFWRAIPYLILPSLALGARFTALLTRFTRSSMLEILGQDYVRTAWAKGLHDRVVLMRHALRNALIPIVTVIGIEVGILLGGSAVIETVFVLPGVGQLVVRSLYNRDLPVIQGLILYVAVVYILVNLVVDLAYTYLDPRLRPS